VNRVTCGRLLRHVQPPAAAWVFVGVFVLALANRLLPVLRGGGLSGVLGYDDGVYYAGAVGLAHGRMPYRDFLLLHPPGVLVALTPVAALGRSVGEVTGWEASRVVWMLMGCCTSLLVARILLPSGKLAAGIGGSVYAVFPGAVLVERTTLLEGLTNLCLASALALLVPQFASTAPRRRWGGDGTWVLPAAAGALLGYATTVKIWGVVPLAVVAVFAAVVVGARFGLVIVLGAVVVVTAVCAPFFLTAPGNMWQMVILDQVGRDRGTGVLQRAAEIATMGHPPRRVLGVAVVAVAILALVVACALIWRIRSLRIAVPLLACTVALLLASPVFFPHYLGALAVPVALVAGAMAAQVRLGLAREGWRRAAVPVGCLVLAFDVLALTRIESGEPVPAAKLGAAVEPAPGCITADDPNTLLALGVVGRNISRGCDLVVDLGGYSHDLSRRTALSRNRNREWQLFVVTYLGDGDYALATRFSRGHGLAASAADEVESWPVRVRADGYELRQPS
jgi:alpha-1,2-mannosyltransferase